MDFLCGVAMNVYIRHVKYVKTRGSGGMLDTKKAEFGWTLTLNCGLFLFKTPLHQPKGLQNDAITPFHGLAAKKRSNNNI